jgi:hypothetical protein
MRRVLPLVLALVGGALAVPSAATPHPRNPPAFARVHDGVLEVGNDLVVRAFSLAPYRTLSIIDRRTREVVAGPGADGWLELVTGDGTTAVPLDSFDAGEVSTRRLPDGGVSVRVPLGQVTRLVEVHPGVAGLTMSLEAAAPLVVSGYALDRVVPRHPGTAVAQAVRAGSDWREPGWAPQLAVGDAQTGDWRKSTVLRGDGTVTGQWLSTVSAGGGVFQVLERVDLPSSVVGRRQGASWAGADLTRDVLPLGPVESDGHVSSPAEPVGRHRALLPGTALERVFTGVAADPDDEPWQYVHALLATRPYGSWHRGVTFNSDSVDHNRISTGAKDDMNLAEVRRQAQVARRLGVDVFVLDDGWQARSGDWCPDSPPCPEPRATWGPRFPDATFAAVRKAISPMRLGLWMSPMAFHPSSAAFQQHPEWTCLPIGAGTTAVNLAQDGSGSNEAGIGFWNPLGLAPDGTFVDYLRGRMLEAVERWRVTYFKLDFLAWFDCAGVEPVDVYRYREAFLGMIDRLQKAHPEVTVQVDETNDYRLWPFESVSRGATWFQNGAPLPPQLLHNVWSLAPFVPSDTIGQAALSSGRDQYDAGYLAAVMLLSHPTVKLDLTQLTAAQVAAVRPWVNAYHRERPRFRGVTYPLLTDPLARRWTGAQIWDRGAQRGVVLAFRQDDAAATASLRLHAVDRARYVVRDLLTGRRLARVSGVQLRKGLTVATPGRRQVVALVVEPVGR